MLRVAAIFKDGMVLQRNADVAIFGETDCEKVEVLFENKKYSTKIDSEHFQAIIKTDDRTELCKLTISGYKGGKEEKIEINNILLGEVWLDGGQSNMELELQNSLDGMDAINNADYENIRFYKVPKYATIDEGLYECERNSAWRTLQGKNCADMSAVAFYFATKLYEKLKVPIGIIDCYQGGTSATCWVSEEALEDIPEVKDYIKEWEDEINAKSDEQYSKEMDEYNASLDRWQKAVDELKKERPSIEMVDINKIVGPYPWPLPRGKASAFRPYGLHKTMISRVAPYTVRGFIYYQAEEDCDRGDYYNKLNSAVIKQWRKDFSHVDNVDIKPFYITQLPMYIAADAEDDKKWCILREQQRMVCQNNEKVGMAVIADCGEYDNIHPIDKKTPGCRLASRVLADVYNHQDGLHNLEISGIDYINDGCVLSFTETYGGICYRESDGKRLTAQEEDILLADGEVTEGILYGFEISNDGKSFYPPSIKVSGERLILKGRDGLPVTDVRYGWFNYGVINLYSKAGVPLMPFWKKATE